MSRDVRDERVRRPVVPEHAGTVRQLVGNGDKVALLSA